MADKSVLTVDKVVLFIDKVHDGDVLVIRKGQIRCYRFAMGDSQGGIRKGGFANINSQWGYAKVPPQE